MLNLNTALYSAFGIDNSSVKKVSGEILNAASNKEPSVQSIDYSKFNRATLGIDLYSSRTNSKLQKQIALTQAGLYVQSINVAQLNSAAAISLYSAKTVQKNVGLTQSTATNEVELDNRIEDTKNIIQLFDIKDKNANSSNGFNPFKESNSKEPREEI